MCKLMQEYKSEIEQFCAQNGLSATRVFQSPVCFNRDIAFVQGFLYLDTGMGLKDETPAPVALRLFRENNGNLRIETTEYTERFLKG